jgi:hypothetical protein
MSDPLLADELGLSPLAHIDAHGSGRQRIAQTVFRAAREFQNGLRALRLSSL